MYLAPSFLNVHKSVFVCVGICVVYVIYKEKESGGCACLWLGLFFSEIRFQLSALATKIESGLKWWFWSVQAMEDLEDEKPVVVANPP